MIIHKEHKHNFTMIDNNLLADSNISWKAKGLLCYLLSKPEGWNVVIADLVNRSTDGHEAIRSAMRELRKYGYLEDVFERVNGVIRDRTLIVRESPLIKEHLDKGNPC